MGGTGIAMLVTYVWRRRFKREFVCCEGDEQVVVWVDGNYAVFTSDLYDAGFPVQTLTVGLPLPGPLGTLGDVLGASVTLATWWVDPNQADGHRPAGPGENGDGNGEPVLLPPPTAECGEWVELPDGTRLGWGQLQPPPPPPDPDDVVTDPPGPYVPPPVESRCCAALDFNQKKPVLEIVDPGTFERAGSHWFVNATLRVSHECELVGSPRVEIYLVQVNPAGEHVIDLTGMQPRLYARHTLGKDLGYEYEFDRQQVPNPSQPPAGKLRIHIVATSTCGVTLDAWYTIG